MVPKLSRGPPLCFCSFRRRFSDSRTDQIADPRPVLSLYPLLHSLEAKNFLTSYEQEGVGKTRKYYSITKDGRKYLKSKLEEWEKYCSAVSNVLAFAI